MNAIFLGGSRRITRLAPEVRQCLDQLIEESSRVLVGDANGADKAFQQYLSQLRYPHVTVFSSLTTARNNVGHWPIERVEPPHKTRDFAFFTAKDAEMARRADRALMIWDGKSAGTMVNVARLVAAGKPVIVYVGPRRSLRTIERAGDLEGLLDACPPAERSMIDRRIGEHVGLLAQSSLF